MASVTLAESAKLAQDELIAGIIENVITVNQSFAVMPFDGIDGNALAYNRENALAFAQEIRGYADFRKYVSFTICRATPKCRKFTSIFDK